MAALFDDHALALIVEDPDLISGVGGIGLAVDARLIQTAEFRAALRRVQKIAGAVIVELVLDGVFLKLLPFLVGDLVDVSRVQHGMYSLLVLLTF